MKLQQKILLGLAFALILGAIFAIFSFGAVFQPGTPTTGQDRGVEGKNLTTMNASRNFSGTNMGNSIYLQWSDLPVGTARILISRGATETGPWVVAIDRPEDKNSPSTVADAVDGTLQDWYYQLSAQDSTAKTLETSPILKVSRSME